MFIINFTHLSQQYEWKERTNAVLIWEGGGLPLAFNLIEANKDMITQNCILKNVEALKSSTKSRLPPKM